jgi:hypothetical protein
MCGTVDIERFTSVDEEVMLVALDNCWVGFDLVGFCVLDDRRGG